MHFANAFLLSPIFCSAFLSSTSSSTRLPKRTFHKEKEPNESSALPRFDESKKLHFCFLFAVYFLSWNNWKSNYFRHTKDLAPHSKAHASGELRARAIYRLIIQVILIKCVFVSVSQVFLVKSRIFLAIRWLAMQIVEFTTFGSSTWLWATLPNTSVRSVRPERTRQSERMQNWTSSVSRSLLVLSPWLNFSLKLNFGWLADNVLKTIWSLRWLTKCADK